MHAQFLGEEERKINPPYPIGRVYLQIIPGEIHTLVSIIESHLSNRRIDQIVFLPLHFVFSK